MIIIKKYNKADEKHWDDFVSASNNGTIFQTRKFLNYHIDRQFKDCSLMIYNNQTLVSVIPGACIITNKKKLYYSHPGTSYGGFVIKVGLNFKLINNIIQTLDAYLRKKCFHQIFLINTPSLYWKEEDHSLDYLLQWNKYKIKEIYISHASNIKYCKTVDSLLSKRKKRYIVNDEKLNKVSFKKIKNTKELKEFYILLKQTKKKFNTKPTHSLEELSQLYRLFPHRVEIYVSKYFDKIIGGSVIFHTTNQTSMIFYNIIDPSMTESQLSVLQLYKSMQVCKKAGADIIDFGVSHTPEQAHPLDPKFSLIKFKEQFGARGVMRIAHQKDLN